MQENCSKLFYNFLIGVKHTQCIYHIQGIFFWHILWYIRWEIWGNVPPSSITFADIYFQHKIKIQFHFIYIIEDFWQHYICKTKQIIIQLSMNNIKVQIYRKLFSPTLVNPGLPNQGTEETPWYIHYQTPCCINFL